MNYISLVTDTVKRSQKEVLSAICLTAVLMGVLITPVQAQVLKTSPEVAAAMSMETTAALNSARAFGRLEASKERVSAYKVKVPATAYNSLPNQTDDTPFLTAAGTHTRHGVIAANFLPLGTRVKIPEIYGDQIFIVEDRMNPRYDKKIDIWMEDYDDAIAFGLKNVTLEVYPATKIKRPKI